MNNVCDRKQGEFYLPKITSYFRKNENNMIPRIALKAETKLVGKCMLMSFANDHTKDLWQGFMPLRRQLVNTICDDLYSLQLYPPGFFEHFNPAANFAKWAAMEVSSFTEIPAGMEPFTISAGNYAVFTYKGAASEAAAVFNYILGTWLPSSTFVLDDRPHFEILGEKFSKDSPLSEEEIWIPVKSR